MNPELLTIEVPEHLLRAIQAKLDFIFKSPQEEHRMTKVGKQQSKLNSKLGLAPKSAKSE